MMPSPLTLVILAAGLGSRFGGNKQFAGFGQDNITLMELNALAAYKAGVRRVIFIISSGSQDQFEQQLRGHLPNDLTVLFAQQSLDALPSHLTLDNSRHKPLGTAHALWCCHDLIDGPFVVTNADDYYGESAFEQLVEHFRHSTRWAMVAYPLNKTLSAFGGVNRGVCKLSSDNQLLSINECHNIQSRDNQYHGMIDNHAVILDGEQLVSMNCWGLTVDFFEILAQAVVEFIPQAHDNEKECMLPNVIMSQLSDTCNLKVYRSASQWFGLTYLQDKRHISPHIDTLLGKALST